MTATHRGHETGASTAAVVIGQFADFTGFPVVMAAGITTLACLGVPSSVDAIAEQFPFGMS